MGVYDELYAANMMLLRASSPLLISYHHPCATRIAGIARGAFELWAFPFLLRLGTANAGLARRHVLAALLFIFAPLHTSFLDNGSRTRARPSIAGI